MAANIYNFVISHNNMQTIKEKQVIVKELQARINAMQGLAKPVCGDSSGALSPFQDAFPKKIFPVGAIHEFISDKAVHAASTNGFITALAGKLMRGSGPCLWIGNSRHIFPSGLKHFGVDPHRILFIHSPRQKDLLWIMEEALKCDALSAVIGEMQEVDFTASRRLQLAVEKSGVNAFIHRFQPRMENPTAFTTRWKIRPLPSLTTDGLPGIGRSRWEVQLLKVRNGRPAHWTIEWHKGLFEQIFHQHAHTSFLEHTGS